MTISEVKGVSSAYKCTSKEWMATKVTVGSEVRERKVESGR